MANKNRKSSFDELLDDMRGKHSKRMNALLYTMDDEDFTVAYFKMLEYSAPKLQRQELNVTDNETKIIIEHVTTSSTKLDDED